jgi:hypothetical protein
VRPGLASPERSSSAWFTAAPMHLKSYQIDGRVLRTGAANFPHPVESARTMI